MGKRMNLPEELKYTKDHEWIRIEGDTGTVGITEHAQAALGDIVFVDLPDAGSPIGQGDEFGTVESVKAVSELYVPISGEIVEVNEALADAPEKVNEDPYGEGWMMKVRLSEPSQIEDLMDAAAYKALVDQENA